MVSNTVWNWPGILLGRAMLQMAIMCKPKLMRRWILVSFQPKDGQVLQEGRA